MCDVNMCICVMWMCMYVDVFSERMMFMCISVYLYKYMLYVVVCCISIQYRSVLLSLPMSFSFILLTLDANMIHSRFNSQVEPSLYKIVD